LRIPQQAIDATYYSKLASFSSLTSMTRFEVPHHRAASELTADVPNTYVPMRNTFFTTLASAALESWMLELIEERGLRPTELSPAIFVGANAIDYSGYPDCRPEFFEKLADVLNLGSKLGTEHGVRIHIEAPIIRMSKPDIVRRALELNAPVHLTWSCYEGGTHPCGTCDSCLLRAAGFAGAGVADPTVVES